LIPGGRGCSGPKWEIRRRRNADDGNMASSILKKLVRAGLVLNLIGAIALAVAVWFLIKLLP